MFGAVLAIAVAGSTVASAQERWESRTELSLRSGAQAISKNDTAIPDHFINVPLVAAVSYHINPNLAAEGEFTWLIPVKQSVDLGAAGGTQDRKTPNVLAYMVNVRGSLPMGVWTPYLTGGLGVITFLSNTDSDVFPQLTSSESAFGIDLGLGTSYALNAHWALRGDLGTLGAFPSKNVEGLSSPSKADPIWMERVTVGVAYRL
jgi:opacity protein-like surface antigen